MNTDTTEVTTKDGAAAVDLVDRLLARRAALYQEYERIGIILAEVAEKASKTATATPATATPPKPRKRRSKGLPASVKENIE